MPEVDGVEMVNLSQAAAAAAAAAGVSVCDEDGALSSRLTGHLSMPHTPPTSAVGSPAALSPELEDIRSGTHIAFQDQCHRSLKSRSIPMQAISTPLSPKHLNPAHTLLCCSLPYCG